MRKHIVIRLLLYLVLFIAANTYAQDKKLAINDPLPANYLDDVGKIFVNDEVVFIDSLKRIYSTYGMTFVLNSAIKWQNSLKEEELKKEKVFENDSVLLPGIVWNAYSNYFLKKNLLFANSLEEANYILNIKILDYGFHWASSSTAGMFVRTKIELVDANGTVVWEQHYCMDKKEAKSPHDRGAINMQKCIDKLITDYEKDPELLEITYKQIVGFLPPKFLNY
jgi:hypothetical protein